MPRSPSRKAPPPAAAPRRPSRRAREFAALLDAAKLTPSAAGRALGAIPADVAAWRSGTAAVPATAFRRLRALVGRSAPARLAASVSALATAAPAGAPGPAAPRRGRPRAQPRGTATVPEKDLDAALAALGLDERAWVVLEARSGFGPRATLEAIGLNFGVSRERVRQIENKAVGALADGLRLLGPALDVFEAQKTPEGADAHALDAGLARALGRAGWRGARKAAVRRVVLGVRALCDRDPAVCAERWPRFSFAACALAPPVTAHPAVARKVAEEQEASRPLSYEELIELVLQQAGGPLHWKEIAERAEKLNRRRDCDRRSIHNTLIRCRDLFVLVGQGTYGLAASGLARAVPYPDVIAEVFLEAGRPLSYGEVSLAVNAKRKIKPTSLQMYLNQHPRFYRSVNALYGLRAWLPPRELQTLRTPDRLVEPPDSAARVEFALAHGYKVDEIVARDRQRIAERTA